MSRSLADNLRETESALGIFMGKDSLVFWPWGDSLGNWQNRPRNQGTAKWTRAWSGVEDKEEKAEMCAALVLYNSKDKTEYTYILKVLMTAVSKDIP